jgi:hypothetical protein
VGLLGDGRAAGARNVAADHQALALSTAVAFPPKLAVDHNA